MAPIGYVLIGCGDCGVRKHLQAYRMFPDRVQIRGVYDPDQRRARIVSDEFQLPNIYPSLEAIWADSSVDIVSVVTPNKFHADICIGAVQAGKHVHVEKPIAMNAVEAERIVQAKNASSCEVMVGLNNRFLDSSRYVKSRVDRGDVGDIYHTRCGWRRRRGIPQWGGWFTDKNLAGGGPAIDLGVHVLDLALHFMTQPVVTTVTATTAAPFLVSQGYGDANMEDFASGFLRCDSGASVAFEFSWASHIEREVVYVELLGTHGGVRYTIYDFATPEIAFYAHDGTVPVDAMPRITNSSGWGENETRHFLDCLNDGIAPSASAEEAVKVMRIIDGIYASASQRKEITLGSAVQV